MATDDDEQNPFTRPGFIAAAVVIALVVVLGIVLVVVNARDDDPGPTPTSSASTSAAPTTDTTAAAGGASVCGLDGAELATAQLTTAPDVDEWAYQGTTAYPVSSVYGPGSTDAAGGFRYCFQRTPAGALFAASFILAAGTDQTSSAWIEYFAAPGPYRDALLQEPSTDTGSTEARLRIAGFRLLAYDGESARVDLALVASTQGETVTASFVYELVWVDGDWKIDTSTPEPGNFSTIPDLAGYVPWGE